MGPWQDTKIAAQIQLILVSKRLGYKVNSSITSMESLSCM